MAQDSTQDKPVAEPAEGTPPDQGTTGNIVAALRQFQAGDTTSRVPVPAAGGDLAEVCLAVNELLDHEAADQGRVRSESMELAMGLSEHLTTLSCAREGDLSVRASEGSTIELVAKLGGEMNCLLGKLEETVTTEQQHNDYLREQTLHLLDVLARVSAGEVELRATISNPDDEMGKLCDGVNAMLATSQEAMEELHRTSLEVGIGVSDFLATLQSATAGDMSVRAQVAYDNEVLATLGQVINRLLEGLDTVTGNIVEASDQLDSAAVQLLSVSQQQSKANSEQAASLTESATSIEELAVAAKEIEGRADELFRKATSNVDIGEQGRQAVAASAQAIDQIGSSTKEAAKRIAALGEKSLAISEVTEIIDGIASRTNMLALNAAIEAARAGEAGRGFSVVAVEIRKLAENVVESTKEIKSLIKEIQVSTSASVMATEQVTKQVERGERLSDEVAASLESMVTMLGGTAESAQGIQVSTGQQTAATDDMAKTVKELTSISQDAAKAARESFESAQELTKLAGGLRSAARTFKT